MNLPTILIGLVLLVLFALAIRYLLKNGTCSECPSKGACHHHNSKQRVSGCGGSCSSCGHCCHEAPHPPF